MANKGAKTKVDELKEALEKRRAPKEKEEGATQGEGDEKGGEKGGIEELTSQITAAEEEAKAHYDKLLRVMAELENFRKRAAREKEELVKYCNENLIRELLIVLDDLNRVLEHVPGGASDDLINFVQGVQLVSKHLFGTLAKFGLEEIKTKGEKFNPEFHEAVAHVPSEEVEQDFIVEENRKGYILNGRVIRAAMVGVSKGKQECICKNS